MYLILAFKIKVLLIDYGHFILAKYKVAVIICLLY
jgi:hypothetical protein